LGNAPLTDEEAHELERWLGDDERRRGMLLRAEATLSYMGRARALAQQQRPAPAERPVGRMSPRSAGRSGRPLAIAACSCALVATAFVVGQFLLPSRAVEIRTAVGEVREVALTNGSFTSIKEGER